MQIKLVRNKPYTKGFTAGILTVDDLTFYTLEDQIREVKGNPVSVWKKQDETAIPFGTYEVDITFSNRFLRDMPLLLNVDGFSGIRIHSGNKPTDTDGCILVGMAEGKQDDDWLDNSRSAFNLLFQKMRTAKLAGEKITIEIS